MHYTCITNMLKYTTLRQAVPKGKRTRWKRYIDISHDVNDGNCEVTRTGKNPCMPAHTEEVCADPQHVKYIVCMWGPEKGYQWRQPALKSRVTYSLHLGMALRSVQA